MKGSIAGSNMTNMFCSFLFHLCCQTGYITKNLPPKLFPYLTTFLCLTSLLGWISRSSNQNPLFLTTSIKISNQNLLTCPVHSNTDTPFSHLKLTPAKLFATVSAWFRFSQLVSLPDLIEDLFVFWFELGDCCLGVVCA